MQFLNDNFIYKGKSYPNLFLHFCSCCSPPVSLCTFVGIQLVESSVPIMQFPALPTCYAFCLLFCYFLSHLSTHPNQSRRMAAHPEPGSDGGFLHTKWDLLDFFYNNPQGGINKVVFFIIFINYNCLKPYNVKFLETIVL